MYVGGPNEDDGYVLVQTIDARAKKASISILNAKDMSLVYRGLAPELGLFGLHTRFFSFDEGCSIGNCVPKDNDNSTTTTEGTTTTTTTTTTEETTTTTTTEGTTTTTTEGTTTTTSTTTTTTTTTTTVTDGTTSINAVHLYPFYLIILCFISLMN